MQVKLYDTSSDPRAINKFLTNEIELSAQLTDEAEILNPTLLLDFTSGKINRNYMYIPEWGRYYFLEPISIINGNQITITGNIDVRMSHADRIKNAECIAERSSSSWEPYMKDPVVADSGKIRTYIRRLNTVFAPNTATNNYVLMIGGKG